MPVAPRLRHVFRDVVRSRGHDYASRGHVALARLDPERVEAHVRGSGRQRYMVRIAAGANAVLHASCSCPHFERGEACKHLWATFCVLDAQGWQPTSLPGGRLRLRGPAGSEEEEADAESLEIDEVAPEPARPVRTPAPPPARPPPRPSQGRSWRTWLGRVARRSFAVDGDAPAAPLLYLIDPDEIVRRSVLRVFFAERTTLRDGSLGLLRRSVLDMDDTAPVEDREEASARARLRALAQADPRRAYGGWAPRPWWVTIPEAFVDSLLPQLATTRRLGTLPGGVAQGRGDGASPEPRWLALDPGPPWQLRLALARGEGGYALSGRFVRDGETLVLDALDFVLAGGVLVHGATLARAHVGGDPALLAELGRGPVRIPARELDAALVALARAPRLPPLELAPDLPWQEAAGTPAPRLRFEAGARGGRLLAARLDFAYGDAWADAFEAAPHVADRAEKRLVRRDREAERAALAELEALGMRRLAGPTGGPPFAVASRDFEPLAAQLLAKGWRLEAEGAQIRQAGASRASVRSGIDFFDLEGGVDFAGETVPFPALLAAAREGSRFVRLGDGSQGLLPREWLARCEALAGLAEPRDDALRFARAHLGVVDALLAAQDESRADESFAALRGRLAEFEGLAPARAPDGFRGELRDYQRVGLGWLRFLRDFGLGGCLADDMGLGKTVQVLALLAGRPEPAAERAPSLVVAPNSVVHGWLAEAERFAPGLRVLRYTGAARASLREQFARSDLVVTTYGTLRKDVEWLREQRFDHVVLDEAQAIKNAASRTARAARELSASQRLALTGTPVENHLGELASLLDFLNPGFLGRAHGLEALGAGADDPAALALLARALRPIVLRRTKGQVLRELPARSEQTLLCELGPKERRQYDELRRHYQVSIGRRIEQDGLARSKIHVLEALLRLRQAACHPALLDAARKAERSAKLDLLFEQLDEVLAEGHKALIFSQFTRFLALVKDGLEARGIPYAYLDGRTRDRETCVARFQEDPACRVFAISLKAGGTGLNLTAADFIFLLDPWWNPAVEAQAIDRTHRIGQTRPVMAYRLVAERTVEEKILLLQEKKRALAESLFGDEKSLIGKLTREDLELLLG